EVGASIGRWHEPPNNIGSHWKRELAFRTDDDLNRLGFHAASPSMRRRALARTKERMRFTWRGLSPRWSAIVTTCSPESMPSRHAASRGVNRLRRTASRSLAIKSTSAAGLIAPEARPAEAKVSIERSRRARRASMYAALRRTFRTRNAGD